MDRDKIRRKFGCAVNMTAAELEDWLETEESNRVGFRRPGETESVGHASGRRIVKILRKPAADLVDADFAHMRRVVGYVHRHRAQRPENIYNSRWRYSLMNWGHDPVRDNDG
jgi:hypothetical protein